MDTMRGSRLGIYEQVLAVTAAVAVRCECIIPGIMYIPAGPAIKRRKLPKVVSREPLQIGLQILEALRPFIMQDFRYSKMGPFHQRQKNIILCDSKRSSFIT